MKKNIDTHPVLSVISIGYYLVLILIMLAKISELTWDGGRVLLLRSNVTQLQAQQQSLINSQNYLAAQIAAAMAIGQVKNRAEVDQFTPITRPVIVNWPQTAAIR